MFGLGCGGIYGLLFRYNIYISISEMLDNAMNYLAFDCLTQCFRLSFAMNSVYRAAKGQDLSDNLLFVLPKSVGSQ